MVECTGLNLLQRRDNAQPGAQPERQAAALLGTRRAARVGARLALRWASWQEIVERQLGFSANPEPFVECMGVRLTEALSECNGRIRLRHVATDSDLVAFLERVRPRLRLPVA